MSRSQLNIKYIITLSLTYATIVYGNEYKMFNKLNPEECILLDRETVITQLPIEWSKYTDFIKICKLKNKNSSAAQTSIISIWVLDYYNARFLSPTLRKEEKFPAPVIVDIKNNIIGQLPQQFPDDPPRELDVFYQKYDGDLSAEILIDVYNPAVSGDYYYTPLKWNINNRRYEMSDKDKKYGHRSE